MGSTPTLIEDYEKRVLGWLRAQAMESQALLKKEPALDIMQRAIDYTAGRQSNVKSAALSRIVDNKLKKALGELTAAMTDVRQIWDYRTENSSYKMQADILNKLVRSWWKSSYSDLRLQDAIKYAGVGGTGYLRPVWNPDLGGNGDIELEVLDPRDVFPIRPSKPYKHGVSDWQGVMIRQRKTINWLTQKYPTKRAKLVGSGQESWFTAEREAGGTIVTTVDRLFGSGANTPENIGEAQYVDFIRVFLKDPTIHTGNAPRQMGKPGTNWAYVVYPVGSTNPYTGKLVTEEDARLYPRGRLILCTPNCILEDIPSPYWYGPIPLVKFTIDPEPWSLLGGSPIGDQIPLQDALNEVLRGMDDGIRQWVKRTVIADKNAVARSMVEKFDTRRAGQYMMLNPSAGEGLKLLEGPNFPPFMVQFPEFLKKEIEENLGLQGIRDAMALKQMPSPESLDKMMENQTPQLRLRGRVLEQALGELAEQVKVLMFQYYDVRRRVEILGDDGVTLEDFDYDPNTLVPALQPGDPNYLPELDAAVDRVTRAQTFHRNFTFSVTPNTFLNMSHVQQKMMYLQLLRINMIDPYTALDAFDVPNLGPAPPGSVFDRIQYYQQTGMIPGPAPAGPGGAPPGGAPGGPGPAGPGRPPSGQQPPQFVQKTNPDGSQRQVVSESGRGGGS